MERAHNPMRRAGRLLNIHLTLATILFASFVLIALYVAAFGAEGTGKRFAESPSADRLQDFRINDIDARLKAAKKTLADRTAIVQLVVEHGRRIDKLETVGLGLLLAAAGGFGTTALGILSVRRQVKRNGG